MRTAWTLLPLLVACTRDPGVTARDAGPLAPTDVSAPLDVGDVPRVDDATADDRAAVVDAPAVPFDAPAVPFDAGRAPCDEVDRFGLVFAEAIDRFGAQDAQGPWPEGAVVFAGSSSIRRWETLALDFRDYAVIQRGIGGAQLAEIARASEALITRHAPRAVVIYAGTNDLALGVSATVTLDRLRCLRHRIGARLGWSLPVLFVSVVPNPSRWAGWSTARAFNEAAQALAAQDPGLVYVDVATPFLATGSPPEAGLFVADGLHLSARGYALWSAPIRAALEAAAPPQAPVTGAVNALAPGERVLVDLGPSNPDDGEVTPSPDHLGQHWNNWHALQAPGEALPGERLAALVNTAGRRTGVSLVVAGGFLSNGRRNGGLRWPDATRLGALAVGSATGDFFFVQNEDAPGALTLRGLDPSRAYTLRLFAARDDAELRVTRYTVHGAAMSTVTLQTSGPGAGRDGGTVNDDDVATLRGVRPDAWGGVFVDVARERGAFAYLSALELIAE
ncbi:MAG: GDSL-type esterase/lipase family protein [Polyangiales bacterium]